MNNKIEKYVKVNDIIKAVDLDCSKYTLCKGCPLSVEFATFNNEYNVCYADKLKIWLEGIL